MQPSHLNAWGERPLVIRNHMLDSRRWERIRIRDGDVVVCSWAKAGTTWVQQIAAQLLFGIGQQHVLPHVSPWIDGRHVSLRRLEARLVRDNHPRMFKSHLEARALPFNEGTKYIYVARDGRDIIWSWYQHHRQLQPIVFALTAMNSSVPQALTPVRADFRTYFREWIERDGYPLWPFWSHIKSWWDLKNRANVLVLHYEQLRRDAEKQAVRIANFLGIESTPNEIDTVLAMSSKAYMASHVSEIAPDIATAFAGAGKAFFEGIPHGWKTSLSDTDISFYEKTANRELGDEIARWLASGYGLSTNVNV